MTAFREHMDHMHAYTIGPPTKQRLPSVPSVPDRRAAVAPSTGILFGVVLGAVLWGSIALVALLALWR